MSNHVVIRDGILFEKEFDYNDENEDLFRQNGGAPPPSHHDPLANFGKVIGNIGNMGQKFREDEEDQSVDGQKNYPIPKRKFLKWGRKSVHLFANGNLVLSPHQGKPSRGFRLFSVGRKPHPDMETRYDRTRIISLDTAGFKPIKEDKQSNLFLIQVVPDRETKKDTIVLGFGTEKLARAWFRDLLGVAAVSQTSKKVSKVGRIEDTRPRRSDVVRVSRAWLQAFHELGADFSDLPERMWNIESSLEFTRGDPVKAYRIWIDFFAYFLEGSREYGNNVALFCNSIESRRMTKSRLGHSSIKVPFDIEQKLLHEGPAIHKESRVSSAISMYYDATGTLPNFLARQELPTLQLSCAVISQKELLQVSVTPEEKSNMDHSIPLLRIFSNNLFEQADPQFRESLLISPEGILSHVRVPVSNGKNIQAALLKNSVRSGVGTDRIDVPKTGIRIIYCRWRDSVPVNEAVSRDVNTIIRGNVLVLAKPEPAFVSYVQGLSTSLRPEYVVCRTDQFRKYCAASAEPSTAIDNKSEITLDVMLTCVEAAAQHCLEWESLFVFPRQVTTTLHAHGVPVLARSLRSFLSTAPKAVAKLVEADLAMYLFGGNVRGATLALLSRRQGDQNDPNAQIAAQKDTILSWLRLSGLMPTVTSILNETVFRKKSLNAVHEELDESIVGLDTSMASVEGVSHYVNQLSRGIHFTRIQDVPEQSFPKDPVSPSTGPARIATVLNHSQYAFEPESRISKTSSVLHDEEDAALYKSMVADIFGKGRLSQPDRTSTAKKRQNSDIEASPSATKWWHIQNIDGEDVHKQLQPAIAWLQVALDRVADQRHVMKNRRANVDFNVVLDAVDSAHDCLPETASLQHVACAIFKACLVDDLPTVLYVLELLILLDRSIPCHGAISKLVQWCVLSVKNGTIFADPHSLALLNTLNRALAPETGNRVRSRSALIKQLLLSNDPMSTFVFSSTFHQVQNNVASLIYADRGLYRDEKRERYTVQSIKSLVTSSQRLSTFVSRALVDKKESESPASAVGESDASHFFHEEEETEAVTVGAGGIETTESTQSLFLLRGYITGLSDADVFDMRQKNYSPEQGGPEGFQSSSNFLDDADFIIPTFTENISENNDSAQTSRFSQVTLLRNSVMPHSIEIRAVSCGHRHSAILTSGGVLLTFGHGEGGRLGHGNQRDCLQPTVVEAFASRGMAVSSVSCGYAHTFAVAEDSGQPGVAFSWGWGEAGRLGQGLDDGIQTLPGRVEMYQVPGAEDPLFWDQVEIVEVACGQEHSLLRDDNGMVYSCGEFGSGRLGVGPCEDYLLSPRRITANLEDESIVKIVAGSVHSMALTNSGVVYSWGFGEAGALGHGDLMDRNEPKRIALLQDSRFIVDIGCGSYHSVAVDRKGKVWCWGDYSCGQLGISVTEPGENAFPRMVHMPYGEGSEAIHILGVSCGTNMTLAFDHRGRAFHWGHPEGFQNTNNHDSGPIMAASSEHIPKNFYPSLVGLGSHLAIMCFQRKIFRQPLDDVLLQPLERTFTMMDLGESSEGVLTGSSRESSFLVPSPRESGSIGETFKHKRPSKINGTQTQSSMSSRGETYRTYFAGTLSLDSAFEQITQEQFRLYHDYENFRINCPGSVADAVKEASAKKTLESHAKRRQEFVPFLLDAMNGLEIQHAAGSWPSWTFVDSNEQLLEWGLENNQVKVNWHLQNNLGSDQVQKADSKQGSSYKWTSVATTDSGAWKAAIIKHKSQPSLPCTNMLVWRGDDPNKELKRRRDVLFSSFKSTPAENAETNFQNVVQCWPAHSEMNLRSVAMCEAGVLAVDEDGALYHIDTINAGKVLMGSVNGRPGADDALSTIYFQRIRRMYLKYAPEKIIAQPKFLTKLLKLYNGKEKELIKSLVNKYGPEPTTWEAMNPSGFARIHPKIVPLKFGMKIVQVGCASNNFYGLTESGRIYNWNALHDNLPHEIEFSASPKPPVITTIACGAKHMLAVSLGGVLYSWGSNSDGQLGHGDQAAKSKPTIVQYFRQNKLSVTRVAAGLSHSAVVTSKGKAFTFGSGRLGALGLPHTPRRQKVPCQVHLKNARFDDETEAFAVNVFAGPSSTIFVATI